MKRRRMARERAHKYPEEPGEDFREKGGKSPGAEEKTGGNTQGIPEIFFSRRTKKGEVSAEGRAETGKCKEKYTKMS